MQVWKGPDYSTPSEVFVLVFERLWHVLTYLVSCTGNLCLFRLEDPRQSPTSSLAEWAIRHSRASMERWTHKFDWVCVTEWVLHQLSASAVSLRVFMLPFSLAPRKTLALTSKLEYPIISSGAFPFGKTPFTWPNSCRAVCNQSKHKTVKRCTACVSSWLLSTQSNKMVCSLSLCNLYWSTRWILVKLDHFPR